MLCLIVVSSAWVFGAGDDSRGGALPSPLPPTRPMAEPYSVLLTRSIFSRDHNRAASTKRVGTYTQPVQDLTASSSALAETNFILKGLVAEDDTYIAFFEQTSERQLLRVRAGESISHGRILAITLDGVDYSDGSKTVRMTIGQSLSGGQVSTTQPAVGPTTRPADLADHPSGEKPGWWRRSRTDKAAGATSN